MNQSHPTSTTASSLPARKITRQQLAALCGLSVRSIDDLTHTGVLGHFKIGKAVRYDLAEVEADLRARFYVAAHPAPGTEGCPQPSAPKSTTTELSPERQESLPPAVDPGDTESRETPDGCLRTSSPTSAATTSSTKPQPQA